MSDSLVLSRSQFLRFSIVGALGFVVDTSVLYAMLWLAGLGPFSGRIISFLAAATFTWLLNRYITFPGVRHHRVHHEWARYVSLMLIGGLANYGVYAACILLSDTMHNFPVLAVAAGSLAGLALNFISSKYFVYR